MTDIKAINQAWATEKAKNPHTAYNSWCRGFEAALAQPEQEPVAWMEDSIEFYAKDHPTNSCTIPLYTAPPSKPWVSLTDVEVEICADMFNGIRLVKAIDALLKERNK